MHNNKNLFIDAKMEPNRKCKTEIVPKLNSVNINQNLKLKAKSTNISFLYVLGYTGCSSYRAWFSTSADVALRITIEGLDLAD